MDMILPIISRWAHVGAAIVAVGGMFFIRLVLMPSATRTLEDDAHASLRSHLLTRWRKVVHACVGLLLLSGAYNYYRAMTELHSGQALYHALAGIKMVVALLVFALSIGLTGRGGTLAFLRRAPRRWLAVNLALAAIVVLISGVLRNLPPAPTP